MEILAITSGICLLAMSFHVYLFRKAKKKKKPVQHDDSEEERRRSRYDDLPSIEDFGHHL